MDLERTKKLAGLEEAAGVEYKLVGGDPGLENSVRGLKVLQDAALEAYHREHARLEQKIDALRGKRGTKLKEPDWSGYHEPGRDREPTPSGGMGGGL